MGKKDQCCGNCGFFKRMFPKSNWMLHGSCKWKPEKGMRLPYYIRNVKVNQDCGKGCKVWKPIQLSVAVSRVASDE